MDQTHRDLKMLDWLKGQPEVYEKLEQMQELEADDPELEKAELDLLELLRSIGAASFGRILQRNRS